MCVKGKGTNDRISNWDPLRAEWEAVDMFVLTLNIWWCKMGQGAMHYWTPWDKNRLRIIEPLNNNCVK